MADSDDPVPVDAIPLVDAFAAFFRAFTPEWKKLEFLAECENQYDEDDPEKPEYFHDSDRLHLDEALADARCRLMTEISRGNINAYIRDPKSGDILKLSRNGWITDRYYIDVRAARITSNFVGPDDKRNPGPQTTLHGFRRPVFFIKSEFDLLLKDISEEVDYSYKLMTCQVLPEIEWIKIEDAVDYLRVNYFDKEKLKLAADQGDDALLLKNIDCSNIDEHTNKIIDNIISRSIDCKLSKAAEQGKIRLMGLTHRLDLEFTAIDKNYFSAPRGFHNGDGSISKSCCLNQYAHNNDPYHESPDWIYVKIHHHDFMKWLSAEYDGNLEATDSSTKPNCINENFGMENCQTAEELDPKMKESDINQDDSIIWPTSSRNTPQKFIVSRAFKKNYKGYPPGYLSDNNVIVAVQKFIKEYNELYGTNYSASDDTILRHAGRKKYPGKKYNGSNSQ